MLLSEILIVGGAVTAICSTVLAAAFLLARGTELELSGMEVVYVQEDAYMECEDWTRTVLQDQIDLCKANDVELGVVFEELEDGTPVLMLTALGATAIEMAHDYDIMEN